jgi:hypothetical protein
MIRNGLCRWKSSAVDIAENSVAMEMREITDQRCRRGSE